MDMLKDRRIILLAGALVVIGLALALGFAIMGSGRPAGAPPPASEGGLVIDVNESAEVKRDPNQLYRCFENGIYVGMATLEQCAQKNGVVSGPLDVGVEPPIAPEEEQPQLSAPPPALENHEPVGSESAPLRPERPSAAVRPPANRTAVAPCLRFERGWVEFGDMPLNACLQELYAGLCEGPGGASYGRWGELTLRLVAGRVEQSRDGRNFRPLVEQGRDCTIPAL